MLASLFTPHLEGYGAALVRLEAAWLIRCHEQGTSASYEQAYLEFEAIYSEIKRRFGQRLIHEWEVIP